MVTRPMLINLENLKALSRHNQSFIREILEVYLTNTPKDIEMMRSAVDSEDWSTVRYYAHKLKSSSFTIGFDEGYRKFQEIEHLVKDEGDINEIPPLFSSASTMCEDCIREVKIELTKYI